MFLIALSNSAVRCASVARIWWTFSIETHSVDQDEAWFASSQPTVFLQQLWGQSVDFSEHDFTVILRNHTFTETMSLLLHTSLQWPFIPFGDTQVTPKFKRHRISDSIFPFAGKWTLKLQAWLVLDIKQDKTKTFLWCVSDLFLQILLKWEHPNSSPEDSYRRHPRRQLSGRMFQAFVSSCRFSQ